MVPIQLVETLVAFKLADHVLVEADPHLPADLFPAIQLGTMNPQPLGDLAGESRRQRLKHLGGPAQAPHGHEVGVSVVVQAGFEAIGVAFVELVGSHHPLDLVAVQGVVVGRQARPEAGDLQDHLGSVEAQELDVAGRLVVVPDAGHDGGVDVTLQTGRIGSATGPTGD